MTRHATDLGMLLRDPSLLQTRAYVAGDAFTAADIQMSFPLFVARQRGGLDATRPHLIDFLERVTARPARVAALRRIGA